MARLTMQVDDNPALLDRMMSDLTRSPELYQPTNYWAFFERHFMPELKRRGLRDFRRRRGSVLSSFGATDLRPRGTIEASPEWPASRYVAAALNRLFAVIPGVSLGVWGSQGDWFTKYFYRYVRLKFEALGLEMGTCGTSRHGNPDDLVEIEGALWSLMHLQYCSMFADAYRRISLPHDLTVCELGAGLGRNIEVIAQLFPRATLLLFDIPPQLYVSNQYLKSVFGDRVIGYDDAVPLKPGCAIPSSVQGGIVILPSWRLPDWAAVRIDLFWNSASFQEMEPDVVANYLQLVSRMSPLWVYINALPGGNYWGEWQEGRGGTRSPVLERYYREALGMAFQIHACYPTDYFLRDTDQMSYIFRRVGD